MRLTALVLLLAMGACTPFLQKISEVTVPLKQSELESGAILYDTLPQKGTLTTTWVTCEGGDDCSAQLRAREGSSRPHVSILMPAECYLTAAKIDNATESMPVPVYRGYVSPVLLTLQKRDVLMLAEGGALVTTFDGCERADGSTESRVRNITFDLDQLTEIGNRLTEVYVESDHSPLKAKK